MATRTRFVDLNDASWTLVADGDDFGLAHVQSTGRAILVYVGTTAPTDGTSDYYILDPENGQHSLRVPLVPGDLVYAKSVYQSGDCRVFLGDEPLAALLANQPIRASAPTYMCALSDLTPYTNATELFTLQGSASKVVRVQSIFVYLRADAQTLINGLKFTKRSAMSTGATPTAQPSFPMDSADPAATGRVMLYSATPTLGAGVDFPVVPGFAGAVSAAAQVTQLASVVAPASPISLHKPVTLRGTAENLSFNIGGTIPTGLKVGASITWTESDT